MFRKYRIVRYSFKNREASNNVCKELNRVVANASYLDGDVQDFLKSTFVHHRDNNVIVHSNWTNIGVDIVLKIAFDGVFLLDNELRCNVTDIISGHLLENDSNIVVESKIGGYYD